MPTNSSVFDIGNLTLPIGDFRTPAGPFTSSVKGLYSAVLSPGSVRLPSAARSRQLGMPCSAVTHAETALG